MGDKEKFDFPTWNYGSTLGLQGQGGGYTEFKDERSYNTIEGYGFCGPRSEGGFGGGGGGRAPLPVNQTDCMPQAVQQQVEEEQTIMDNAPGVIIKNDDGSLVKVTDPNAPEPIPVTSEPTRFDKSVHGILNGRNAAMFVNLEAKKRGWDIELEEVESGGPVHDRTYSYTLAIGPDLVTAGIAKSKKESKRRCCEAMVLKIDDLPPAPPLHMQPHMRGRFPFPGRFQRGGRMPPFGFSGQRMPFFRPRLPPPESEETIFKKYDTTPKDPHPSHNHPISKLCEKAKQHGWPQPAWDLVTEKVVDTKKHKHGRHNTMLYTFKVTVYPGKGQVEPKSYFGSGPTKKDAKFACGSVAWADIGSDEVIQGKPAGATTEVELVPGDGAEFPIPGVSSEDPAQDAVNKAAEMNKPKKRAGEKITETKWLDIVAKSAEKEKDLKFEIDKERELKRKLDEEIEAKRKQQLAEEKVKREIKEEPRGSRKRSRSRGGSRRRSRSREEVKKEIKEEPIGSRKRSRSRDGSRRRSRSRDDRRKKSRSRDRSGNHRDAGRSGHKDDRGFDERNRGSSYRDDRGSSYRDKSDRDRGSSYRDDRGFSRSSSYR